MNFLVLRSATRFLLTLMLLYAVFLLLRGHEAPGGGFVAGLVASGGWILYGIAFGTKAVRSSVRFAPQIIFGLGLWVSIVSGLVASVSGGVFLSARWITLEVTEETSIKLGTPLLFDLGVFLVVLGAVLIIFMTIPWEEDE